MRTPAACGVLGASSLWTSLAVVLCLSPAAPTAAQSCCSATAANDFGVVGRCNYAIVASELSYEHGMASYSADGELHPLRDIAYRDLVGRVGAGLRLPFNDIQVHGQVPVRIQHRRLGAEDDEISGGVGDASAAVRWTVMNDTTDGIGAEPGSYRPYLDIFLGAKAPTGNTLDDSSSSSNADVTGTGVWELGAGLKVSKYITGEHVVQVMGQYAMRTRRALAPSSTGGPTDYAPGDLVTTQLGWIQIESIFWSWGASANFEFTGAASQHLPGASASGELTPIDDSQTHRLRVGGFITRALNYPTLDLTLNVSFDPPLDGSARNIPFAGPSVGLKLAYNFIDKVF